MTFGPGIYDDICSLVREKVGISDQTGGAVMLVIIGGDRGHGFSCHADLETTLALPDVLQQVVWQMRESEADVKRASVDGAD